MAVQLLLGGLDKETTFIEFDVDCDADLILGYDWLRMALPFCMTPTKSVSVQFVEPLPHVETVEQLVDQTRGARFYPKLDLAMAYMQFQIQEEDQY